MIIAYLFEEYYESVHAHDENHSFESNRLERDENK